jgi:signal transduction histidine kinase
VQVEVDTDDGSASASATTASAAPIPTRGSGLVGLKDRVEATGGTLRVESRPGQGPRLLAELPVDAGRPPDSP